MGAASVFFREFLSTFTTTGAIAPSSPFLARAMTRPLSWRPATGNVAVLEIGPGTGAFTRRILKLLRPGDTFDLYELNPRFCEYLIPLLDKARIARPGIAVTLHQADIMTIGRDARYDFIISGLPYTNFDVRTASKLLSAAMSHLRPDGVFSFFDYIIPRKLRMLAYSRKERERYADLSVMMDDFFTRRQVGRTPVPLNIPPAWARHFK